MQYPLPEKKTISVKATLIKCYLVDIIENLCQYIASKSKHFTGNDGKFIWRKFFWPNLSITIVGLFSCELPSSVEGLKSGKHR